MSSSGKGGEARIRINSTLIKKASGVEQDELSGLGVSVYNQNDFEAGVLEQLDKEVQKRNAEQQRKFLLKDYSNIKAQMKTIQLELTGISKTIAGLLMQPLSQVVVQLRELKSCQSAKRKQLETLEARERSVLKKLSGGEGNGEEPNKGTSNDVSFGLPLVMDGGRVTEQQKLIQTGQLTPFGGQVDESAGNADSASSSISDSADKLDVTASDSTTSPSSSVAVTKAAPTIRLSNNSFDGLFSGTVLTKPTKISSTQRSKSHEKTTSSHTDTSAASASEATPSKENVVDQVWENGELVNGELDADEWMPNETELAEFESEMLSSSDSEYLTDDELGSPKKKKKRLRELSSDEDDDESHVTSKRRGRKQKLKWRSYQDDGDDELFKLRIRVLADYRCHGLNEVVGMTVLQGSHWEETEEREYEREQERAGGVLEEDKVFSGGLRIPGSIWHKLYRYQQTGVKWLWELHCQQAGGIVGDEMGLGKTIQMIAFLAGLKVSNLRSHVTRELGLGAVLVVCPATVMHQWVCELHTWWPPFRAAILHVTGSFGAWDKKRLVDTVVKDCGVLITTYAGIRIYQDLLTGHKWDYVILDEGHKIRNPDAEITLTVKQFATPHRLILSGSPMQNNLKELWSLFDFVFPGKLGTLPVFMEQFSIPITQGGYANATEVQVQTGYRCACVLRDTINPYLLRRLKADVKIQLPDKSEQVLFCQLTDYQKEIYQDFLKSKEVEEMLAGQRKVFAGLTTLRKLCNHPDLVTNDYSQLVTPGNKGKKDSTHRAVNADSAVSGGAEEEEEREDDQDFVVVDATAARTDDEGYGHWRRSGKMVVVESLLRLWKDQGHRVLLFSQTKMMLDILERFVAARGFTYRRMDGTTPISTRQPLINEFNKDDSVFIFLLTTRVGGLGVNLTGADRVIIYDPDWNPSTDTQARERAWRIGQTKQVTVYRLLTSGTIEEKIYHRQIFKQFLTNRILKDPRQRRFFKSNHLHDLFTLDSSATDGGTTETSALFAGTGSEILPPVSSRSHKKRKRRDGESSGVRDGDAQEAKGGRKRRKRGKGKEKSCDNDAAISLDQEGAAGAGDQATVSSPSRTVRKKRKKRKKKQKKVVTVDGCEIEGLEKAGVFEPGRGDEEGASNKQQDDYILKTLFKKSGVHSAMQHDTIMSSANPDYVLVEGEAKKVAESAVKALKTSRRQCQQLVGGARRWGQPTWTGQHGTVGAPHPPRFGHSSSNKLFASDKTKEQQRGSMETSSSAHFDGAMSGTSTTSRDSRLGSTNTASSFLLAKMRSRNAHIYSRMELRSGTVQDIHSSEQSQLLSELRDFIATQCKTDGQATTVELLKHFSHKLPSSDTVLFKSLLHEICNFHRHLGEGLWSLKPEFR